MKQNKAKRQIELLKMLAKGYKKHPAYRAIRKSIEIYDQYEVVWQAKVELKNGLIFYGFNKKKRVKAHM